MTQFNPLGTTEEVTTCDCCGKRNLKVTVALEHDDGGIVYYGRDCAGKALYGRKNRRNTDLATVRAEEAQMVQPVIDAAKANAVHSLDAAKNAAENAASEISWTFRGVMEGKPHFWRRPQAGKLSIIWRGINAEVEVGE